VLVSTLIPTTTNPKLYVVAFLPNSGEFLTVDISPDATVLESLQEIDQDQDLQASDFKDVYGKNAESIIKEALKVN
jgi:hypothetical protein